MNYIASRRVMGNIWKEFAKVSFFIAVILMVVMCLWMSVTLMWMWVCFVGVVVMMMRYKAMHDWKWIAEKHQQE
jgi:hypothetical protein